MELALWITFAAMFALLVYTIVWVSIAIRKKAQPGVDSFFDAVHGLLSIKNTRPCVRSDVSQQESRPAGAADNRPKK